VGVNFNLYFSIISLYSFFEALIETIGISGFFFLNSSTMSFDAVQPSQ
jgi:hypothetical protein|tara:strand:+ start:256 stop:399 length:144 start_codon:yes stop_codon:yes gene_type:complete